MTPKEGPPVVVMAAGLSTRYGRPKQVDPIGPDGAAIMDYTVFDAARAGFSRAIYVIRLENEEEIRDHVARFVGGSFPVEFVHQTLDDVPPGFRPPPDRRRPWGTGHAILCASSYVSSPFAVCNADDLYGPNAFRELHAFLEQDPLPAEAALVGYTLAETLSGRGGVSRGICVLGRDRMLEQVTEVKEIHRVDGWISGVDPQGEVVELRGDEIVSMNLWGLTPAIVEGMRRQFVRFLDHWGTNTDAEFLLSTAINRQIRAGTARCAVLPTDDQWFGVTHRDDRDAAVQFLEKQVEAGFYPADLSAAFRSLRPAG